MVTVEHQKIRDKIRKIADELGCKRSSLLPIMQNLQKEYGVITDAMMQETAEVLGIKPMDVYSTISFYSFFNENPKGKYIIRLCRTISCHMVGKENIARQLENELGIKFGQTTNDKMFTLEYTNCLGMCDQGPAMMINDKIYTKLTPEKVYNIINEIRENSGDEEDNLGELENSIQKKGPILNAKTTEHEGLKKALKMARKDVISVIRESGLKGRGGAGFPTAIKWQIAAATEFELKYVVCNADEGEPGTFKDRLLIMEYVDLLLDGMIIAGYTIGAKNGIIYLRGEYSFLKNYLEDKIKSYYKENLLGKDILGKKGFEYSIEIRMGSGAYVCGEETALIESLEGKRGEPRNRPPFPVVVGYEGFPTAVNNVETFIDAALIIDKGAKWFKSYGTEKTTGTKIFSVSGDCKKPGIYEMPMGITVKELLKEVGSKDAKAVQIGGASGSCIPRSQFERKITYEDVATGGSIIVFNSERNMLDVAINFMEFFVEESCGQCFLCRIGNAKILEGLEKLKEGKCSIEYLNSLKALGKSMQKASKCGLGQSSANAFLSILENFKDEIFDRVPVAN